MPDRKRDWVCVDPNQWTPDGRSLCAWIDVRTLTRWQKRAKRLTDTKHAPKDFDFSAKLLAYDIQDVLSRTKIRKNNQ